jgi:serine/threonine protein phosphatase PrpC
MANQLAISIGQFSDRGRKDLNQDFHGVSVPKEPHLSSKGIAIALADGISSSAVSQVAAQATVTSFLDDYYCTSDAWSTKKSVQRVLAATNSWLYSQTLHSPYRYEKDRGYVCTLSALVIKSTTAHIFHLGDARIYRLRGRSLEQLTTDHRTWVSHEHSYLSRAMGINEHLEIDYASMPVEKGDIFVLTTDGVYEFVKAPIIASIISSTLDDLDKAVKTIVALAFEQGSIDNLTVQIIRIDDLPSQDAQELLHELTTLPVPGILEARQIFDGYKIIRQLHASGRSHVYLAVDIDTEQQVVLKTPSTEFGRDPAYLERFSMEEWIAKRLNSPHVLKPTLQTRKRNYLYIVTEYIEGQTLAQWMIDNPSPSIETVRNFIEQIAKGLRAFHRLEMLHQDLRPANIMIDTAGTLKLIDFGSTIVAGVSEIAGSNDQNNLLGTAQYAAPEYFLGDSGTARSDLYSLGVVAYQMLTQKLPYGALVARSKTVAEIRKLRYTSARNFQRDIPVWVDEAIKKAVQPNPLKRYDDLMEFVYDLRHPNKAFLKTSKPPLIERNPVVFWQCVCAIQVVIGLGFWIANSVR